MSALSLFKPQAAREEFDALQFEIGSLKREEDKNEATFNEHMKEQTDSAMKLKHILGNERLRMQESTKNMLDKAKSSRPVNCYGPNHRPVANSN